MKCFLTHPEPTTERKTFDICLDESRFRKMKFTKCALVFEERKIWPVVCSTLSHRLETEPGQCVATRSDTVGSNLLCKSAGMITVPFDVFSSIFVDAIWTLSGCFHWKFCQNFTSSCFKMAVMVTWELASFLPWRHLNLGRRWFTEYLRRYSELVPFLDLVLLFLSC